MFSSSPETLILRPPNLRTNSSSLSRTSPLTNTGLRSSILGTWRKVFLYSSRESFLCLVLIRRWDVGTASSFPVDGCRFSDMKSVCSTVPSDFSFPVSSRMIPGQFQCCHLTGVWVTCPYLSWPPILLWSISFLLPYIFDFNRFTHWSRCAPWLIVVSKGSVYSEQNQANGDTVTIM